MAIALPDPRSHVGRFDHYARLTQRVLDAPVALVSLVESDRQVFVGALGLPEPYQTSRETDLSQSLCRFVADSGSPLVVDDLRDDDDLADCAAVTDFGFLSYAGWPLHDADGTCVGSLCAVDQKTRAWSESDRGLLADLAHACSVELQQGYLVTDNVRHLARAIFDSVDVAMAFYDTSGRLVMANELARRASDLVGFSLDEPPHGGPNVWQADQRVRVAVEDQMIPRALRGDLGAQPMEWLGPPGQQRAHLATSQPITSDDGSVRLGTLIVGHDVTALARALAVKDEFVTTVSHELRTPLTSILATLELVFGGEPPSTRDLERSLQIVQRNAQRLSKRIGDLLETAEQRRRLVLAPEDVSSLVTEVCDSLRQHASDQGVRLEVDAPAGLFAVIDAARLEQAVENLLTNAVKYVDGHGTVAVTCSGSDTALTIRVEDDGVGMTTDDTEQAFDDFWRAPAARDRAIAGIGLGLGIVREIVHAHHGTVELRSEPGVGTTVVLTLPRSSGHRPGA